MKRIIRGNKNVNFKTKILGTVLLVTALIGISISLGSTTVQAPTVTEQYAYEAVNKEEFKFLSDLSYITTNNWSYVSWGSIRKDLPPEGSAIKLIVGGQTRMFPKGLGIHANSQLTYNIGDLSDTYIRFVTYAGVDASRGSNGNGVKFTVSASTDGDTWTTLYQSNAVKGNQEALNIDVEIAGYKYLRIIANNNGNETADHAVLADARLITKDYVPMEYSEYSKIRSVSYYDEILSAHDTEYNMNNNYKLILEREVVNKLGYETIQGFANISPNTRSFLDWMFASDDTLEKVIEVGNISSGTSFLNVLSELYATYSRDLTKENGDVYKKMMIGLTAAYTTDKMSSPLTFSHKVPSYDYIERYGIFKELYEAGLFQYGNGFKQYHVEMFRIMMNGGARNDELRWLNYIGRVKKYSTGVYSYVQYVKPNYSMSAKPHLYDIANKEKYDTKYHLTEYGVPFADNTTRYWMVMEAGGICWNQARFTKSAIMMMGRPSITVFQPEHESALFYAAANSDGTGRGSWGIAGNIFGWGSTSNSWYGGNRTRTLFAWSYKSFVNHIVNGNGAGTSAGYIYLAQDNLERYDDYKKSVYLNLLANSYKDQEDKINIYNKSLEVDNINLDTYDYKIGMYKATNKSSDEWYQLAQDIIDNYTFYPMAMNDLLKLIKPYLNGVHRVDIDQKEQAALKRASKATTADVFQNGACQSIANAILKKTKANLASFSFDGANSGKIILDKAYDSFKDLQWKYSLDGGKTVSAGTIEHSVQLSASELESITAESDIQIYIVGLRSDVPSYTIDIVNGSLPTNLYGNDLENRVIGATTAFEWRHSENEAWTSYKTASPNNNGDVTLYVRMSATGNKLVSPSATFTFTEDNQPDTEKYIPINYLSIHSYSTQSVDTANRPFYAPNAIDGNIHTMWHTDFRYDVRKDSTYPFITIELDKPRYISALEFVQQQYKVNDPDFIKNANVYVSNDGENWTLAARLENCAQNEEFKKISFEESLYGKYVKFETETYNMFSSAAMINLFEDTTKLPPLDSPTANIWYSITGPTNKDVIARLVNPSSDITIINNGGNDSITFKQNGEFTFEFIDNVTGLIGRETAHVNWIDKVAPTATINYSTLKSTNKTVTATLVPSEDIIITNNGEYAFNDDGKVVDKNGTIYPNWTVDSKGDIYDVNHVFIANMNTFTFDFYANGEFTFEFIDTAGNKGSAKAEVTWIDTEAPEATLFYDFIGPTNKDVVVNLQFNEPNVKVLNNDGIASHTFAENGSFTFKFEDEAGNANEITANVSWIDKAIPTAEVKYERVGDKIIVRVVNPSKDVTFQIGNGVYEFAKNGEYTIVFYDKAGNAGKVVAKIAGLMGGVTNDDNPTNPDNTDKNTSNGNTVNNNKPNTNNNDKTNNDDTNKKIDDTDKEDNSNENRDDNSNEENQNKIEEESSNSIFTYIVLALVIVALAGTIIKIVTIRKKNSDEFKM